MNVVSQRLSGPGALVSVLAVCTAPSLFADTFYGSFVKDRSVVYSETANLFAMPSENSEVLCSLPVGTLIRNITPLESTHDVNGLISPWMQGACEVGGRSYSGFIPMSQLALTDMELQNDTLFIFGLDEFWSGGLRYSGQAKIVFAGNVLQRFPLTPPDGFSEEDNYLYCVSSRLVESEGFPGARNLITLSFNYEACGYVNRDYLLAWTGSTLAGGVFTSSVTEAGIFHYFESFIFPDEDPRHANVLRVASLSEEFDEKVNSYFTVSTDTTEYSWNGNTFTQY